jgi:PAS domain S-box-containing protein
MFSLLDENEIVLNWRKKIFMGVFVSFLVFISVPYFMSCRFVLQNKMWISFSVYTFSYLSIFIIVIFNQIPFKIKVMIGLLAFYSLGIVAFVYAVAGGSAKLYLLASSIIATLLLGIKSGIFTILINACTLIIVGYFVANGTIVWIEGIPFVMKVYILTATTFMFLNTVLTISLAALVRGLEKKLIESQNAAYQLKLANIELIQNQEQQIKLEEQLRQSEHRFSTIFKNNPAAIALSRMSNNQLLEVNQAWLNLTEYSISEVIGRSVNDLNIWVDTSQRKKIVENLRNKGISQEEIRGFKKSGVIFEVLMSAEIIELNKEPFFLTMAQDITQRKQAEKALIESELQFKFTFEQAAVGICHVDPNGKFVRLNQRFCEIVGYPQGEILSYKWQEITHPDDLEMALENVHRLLNNDIQTFSTEKRFIKKDKSIVWTTLTVSLVRNDDGNPKYFIFVLEDIGYRKKMEEQLLQSHKMKAISTLAGGIAHDFNNLLGVITGNISYVLSIVEKNDEIYEALVDIQESSKQAQNLTYQLLTFSKGGAPIKKVSNMNQLINESAIFSIRGSKTNCQFELSSDLWLSNVDEGQMNQVIGNLIINANQAMPDGGTITIRTTNTTVYRDSGFPLAAGQYVKITVEDQGTGISKKHLSNIFEPYYSTKQKGSGLGLATSYSIIKRHGGHITVYSEIDKGTVFNIYLPASSKNMIERVDKSENIHFGKGKILIMDDQEPILKMVSRMLSKMGYDATSATDGTQAINIYRKAYDTGTTFDLVILDLTVPGGMGGAKTMQALLEIDPNVNAVVSSGYSNDPIMAKYKDYGFCGVVPKPYTKNQLSEVLNKILGKSE